MSLETKLETLLSGDAGIVAIVGTRVYSDEAPQDLVLPYIVYQRISSGRQYSFSGYSNLENPRVQIDCYSSTKSGAVALCDAVVAAMRAATTFSTSGDDPQAMPPENGTFRMSIDFFVWNQEA